MLIDNLKHISIWYYNPVESVKLMIQEHYDKPEYDNTLFILNLYWIVNDINENLNNKYKRIIYYNLEHKLKNGEYTEKQYDDDKFFAQGLINIGVTEFWSMDYESEFGLIAQNEYSIPLKYVPVRYTTLIKQVPNIYSTPKTIDYCHVGSISSSYRQKLIQNWEWNPYGISFKFITSTRNLSQCIPEMNASKFIIDTFRDERMIAQNQVRIFELLCMGYTVCVEKSDINMFPGLIYEWSTIDELYEIVKNNQYLHPTEAYKEMTYIDEAYNKYANDLIIQWNVLN